MNRLIEIIFSLVLKYNDYNTPTVQFLIEKIKEAVEVSDINVSIKQKENKNIILYPKVRRN